MKKIIWLFSIVFLMICLLVLTDTYALFETNATSESDVPIGKWVIEVNGQDVSLQRAITLSNFTYSENSHTEDGYFAPGRSAEFEIEIDASESDVSVMYDLEIDDSQIVDHPNIYFSITDMDTNEVIQSNNISGIIYLSDQNRVKTLKINLVWSNSDEYDELDTSLIDGNLQFNIDANFIQYIGE